MIANIQFDNIEEMQEFAKLISGGCSCNKEQVINISAPAVESTKEEQKDANKAKTSKKADKAKDKKEEPPKVEAEVTGIDESANGKPVQDVGTKEENKTEDGPQVTKEMVREICSKAIKAGKPADVKKIVADHGASKIPELKEKEYAAVYKEVEALL